MSISAPLVLDDPMNGEAFLAYVRQILGPSLRKEDIVVMDTLPAHETQEVQASLKATDAQCFYLPPYSPDMNPIEMAFSKPKALLRQESQRTTDALWDQADKLIERFSAQQYANFFKAAGYAHSI